MTPLEVENRRLKEEIEDLRFELREARGEATLQERAEFAEFLAGKIGTTRGQAWLVIALAGAKGRTLNTVQLLSRIPAARSRCEDSFSRLTDVLVSHVRKRLGRGVIITHRTVGFSAAPELCALVDALKEEFDRPREPEPWRALIANH